MMSNA
jgi:splicing factor 3B subunit 3